jgi:hypothetical protein
MRRDISTQIERVQAIDANEQHVLDATRLVVVTDSVGTELGLWNNRITRSVATGSGRDNEGQPYGMTEHSAPVVGRPDRRPPRLRRRDTPATAPYHFPNEMA